jgi:hypothetical protein
MALELRFLMPAPGLKATAMVVLNSFTSEGGVPHVSSACATMGELVVMIRHLSPLSSQQDQ